MAPRKNSGRASRRISRCKSSPPTTTRSASKIKSNSASTISTKIPNGGPGIEHRLSLIYTGGVHGKRFSPNRFVEVVSTSPAKLFGLFPRKGTIAVGSDADIVIFDPNHKEVISAQTHHMRVDYSMFEGIQIQGAAKTVLSRGRTIIDKNQFTGRPGSGQFLRRQTYAGLGL